MFYKERQASILEYIQQKPSVSVAELSDIYQVSTVTIRKDLNSLSKEGKIERTHGGAMNRSLTRYEADEDEREGLNTEKKKEIAARAYGLIKEGSTVILDAGSTTLELARLLAANPVKNVTLITHALNIALVFQHSHAYTLIMIGGQYRPKIMSFVGPYAVKMLQEIHADIGFIGINGFTLKEGLTTPSPYEAQMKLTILERSRESYLLTDLAKFGNIAMSKVADLSKLDGIICDSDMPEKLRHELDDLGLKII